MISKSNLARALLAACLSALVVLGAGPSLAGEKSPLGLRQAIEAALAYSPQLKAVGEQLNQARYGEKEAFTYFLPTLGTSYGWVHYDAAPTFDTNMGSFVAGTQNNYQWASTIKQPIFTGLRISSNYRLAELGVDLAQMQLTLARLDLTLGVTQRYLGYLRAQKGVEVANQAVLQLESQLKTSQDFFEVGIIPENDVLKVQVELSNARQQLVSAENSVAITRAQLNSLIGREVDRPLAVEDILRYQPWDLSFGQARGIAESERPELKAADLKIKQADQTIAVAQSGYYPQVSFQATYTRAGEDPDLSNDPWHDASETQLAAVLEWSFWEWGRTSHQVSREKAGRQRLLSLKKDLEDQVVLEVKQAFLFLREAEKNIGTAKTAIRQAQENYRITQERYREQLTTNTELLDAQTLLTRAQDNFYNALTQYNLAKAQLRRAMGRGLPPAGGKS